MDIDRRKCPDCGHICCKYVSGGKCRFNNKGIVNRGVKGCKKCASNIRKHRKILSWDEYRPGSDHNHSRRKYIDVDTWGESNSGNFRTKSGSRDTIDNQWGSDEYDVESSHRLPHIIQDPSKDDETYYHTTVNDKPLNLKSLNSSNSSNSCNKSNPSES